MQIAIDGQQFVILSISLAGAILVGWLSFFYVAKHTRESLRELIGGSFIQNLTVILVVAVAGCLALARVLSGEVTATLLSGIVGYVLGSVRTAPTPASVADAQKMINRAG
jgi:hypothetical protein